jgi:hypothetical protein
MYPVIISVSQILGDRDFIFRIFSTGHSDSIADSFGKKGGNTDCRLDSTSVTVAGFSHAQV